MRRTGEWALTCTKACFEANMNSNECCCFFRLNQVYCQLVKDNEALTADHKQLKTQMNEIKLEKTWLEADFSKLKTELQQLDITSMKLSNQCEV